MQEIWKDIPNYEGLYQVSNLGRVKSTPICKHKKPRILKNIPRNGYISVILCDGKTKKNVFVHRLVAECFVPNPENKPIVNHIDGNKSNPCSDNLEWCTQSENIHHAIENGLFFGRGNGSCCKIFQFDISGNLIKEWVSAKEIESNTDYKLKTIYNSIYWKRKTAYGFVWTKNPSFPTNIPIKIPIKKTNSKFTKTKICQYTFDGKLVQSFSRQVDAFKATGISQSQISLCVNGKIKQCGGFIWRKEDK